MDYTMVRPCAKCPFRDDITPYLTEDRVYEIGYALENGTFPCHETVDYSNESWYDGDEYDEDEPYYVPTGDEKHCAGAMIMLEKMEMPSQMMRICERLKNDDGTLMYDRDKLDMDSPVYDNIDEMASVQDR